MASPPDIRPRAAWEELAQDRLQQHPSGRRNRCCRCHRFREEVEPAQLLWASPPERDAAVPGRRWALPLLPQAQGGGEPVCNRYGHSRPDKKAAMQGRRFASPLLQSGQGRRYGHLASHTQNRWFWIITGARPTRGTATQTTCRKPPCGPRPGSKCAQCPDPTAHDL
jgi:hypothetical protein